MELNDILHQASEQGASDIHLVPGHVPMVRIDTVMVGLELPVLSAEVTDTMVRAMASDEQFERLQANKDLDISYAVEGLGRYRVNIHQQRSGIAMAMRSIRESVPPLESLNLPLVVQRFATLPRGLVLVTGDTGSGKSTTLAAVIQAINAKERKHIITLEDPIEYTFESRQCLIEQRELGDDIPTFASGLKHALRQDPDIILVGEMRDLETTALAMSAAETGHLVLSTLHTVSASQTVERIIDMYPANQQNQVRSMLGNTLQAVVSQSLFPRADGEGMVPAVEILLCTPAVRNLIRENRTFEIPNVIETSRNLGMTTLDASIAELCFNGLISKEDAVSRAAHPEAMERALAA
ncbi:MAG: type IV pilus twitching motility protein PilT [Planctomycetes bacterium]|jgi:twitching motility protein PilT|nr:type IV pilus twitching motility protein PilT [Planctomycetota bacterium]MCP4838259.1 type IV pilus twitching motility protein PilT [Planctomycetota bacterium]